MSGELTILSGGRKWSFRPGSDVRIGSEAGCDVVLESRHVSDLHVLIRHDDRGWVAINRGADGTFRAGRRITELRLGPREVLILGDPRLGESVELLRAEASHVSRLRPVSPDDEATEITPRRRRPGGELRNDAFDTPTVLPGTELHVEVGGRAFQFPPRGRVTIGRHPDNDVVVSSPTASRRHAVVSHDSQGWRLDAVAGASPTYVEGRQIISHRLAASTEVLLGDAVAGERLVVIVGSLHPLASQLHSGLSGVLGDDVHLGPIRLARRTALFAIAAAMILVAVLVLALASGALGAT